MLGIVAAVALLGAGIYLVYRNWRTISDFFTRTWTRIRDAVTGVTDRVGGFKNALLILGTVVAPFITIPILIWRNWSVLTDRLGGAFERVKMVVNAVFGNIKSGVRLVADGIIRLIELINTLPFVNIETPDRLTELLSLIHI